MDLLYDFYNSAAVSELIRTYASKYQHTILLVLLVIALLNCFFGFHLRKLWGILAGMFIGALVSATVCIYIEKTGYILYIAALLGAFTLGLLALLLYRVGLFFICALLIPMILGKSFPTLSLETELLWITLGIICGVLTLVREREIISTVTAIGGGFAAAKCISLLQNHHSSVMIAMVGIALSLTGILLQFQPWRSRSSWNSDEERARDNHRHKRRMKRIRKKKKAQERIEQKNKGKTQALNSKEKNRETMEYKPYTTRPIYQNSPEFSTEEAAASPDLSDIRQSISREVSDIYQNQQQDMDEALNQLLEKEYQNTTKSLKKR